MMKLMQALPTLKTNNRLYGIVLEFLQSELGDYSVCTYNFIASAESENYIEFRIEHDFHPNYGTVTIDMGFSLGISSNGSGDDILMLDFGDDNWHEIAFYDETVKYFWMKLLSI